MSSLPDILVSITQFIYENIWISLLTYTSICFVFCMNFILYRRELMTSVFLQLAYFPGQSGLQFEPLCCKIYNFVLFMAVQYSMEQICHGFFVHSFFYGNLGCSHVFTLVNCAAVNTWLHVILSYAEITSFCRCHIFFIHLLMDVCVDSMSLQL